jgi:hypothetical protein
MGVDVNGACDVTAYIYIGVHGDLLCLSVAPEVSIFVSYLREGGGHL